jgi:hypothetical protein
MRSIFMSMNMHQHVSMNMHQHAGAWWLFESSTPTRRENSRIRTINANRWSAQEVGITPPHNTHQTLTKSLSHPHKTSVVFPSSFDQQVVQGLTRLLKSIDVSSFFLKYVFGVLRMSCLSWRMSCLSYDALSILTDVLSVLTMSVLRMSYLSGRTSCLSWRMSCLS